MACLNRPGLKAALAVKLSMGPPKVAPHKMAVQARSQYPPFRHLKLLEKRARAAFNASNVNPNAIKKRSLESWNTNTPRDKRLRRALGLGLELVLVHDSVHALTRRSCVPRGHLSVRMALTKHVFGQAAEMVCQSFIASSPSSTTTFMTVCRNRCLLE